MTRRAVVAVGSVLMGLGNWSMSVKLEKASSASTGRHVNVAEPLRWVHYGPSHAAFSHQKSHQCIKRYSLGIDKLMLSFFPDWYESLLNSVMGGNPIYNLSSSFSRKTSFRKMEIIYGNTIVFSKTMILPLLYRRDVKKNTEHHLKISFLSYMHGWFGAGLKHYQEVTIFVPQLLAERLLNTLVCSHTVYIILLCYYLIQVTLRIVSSTPKFSVAVLGKKLNLHFPVLSAICSNIQ